LRAWRSSAVASKAKAQVSFHEAARKSGFFFCVVVGSKLDKSESTSTIQLNQAKRNFAKRLLPALIAKPQTHKYTNMKKQILTLTASLACVAAFAQGKISFQTDSLHLAYYDPSVGGGLGGLAADSGNQPVSLSVDLYMGTSSTALSLYASTTLQPSSNPGKWGTVNIVATGTATYGGAGPGPAIPGGTSVFVVTQIRDSANAPATSFNPLNLGASYAQAQGYSWYGWSSEFSFTLGTSTITYPAMYTAPTWAAGGFDLSSSVSAGAKGAIAIFSVPEPSTAALAGLALAGMAIFRRRK
jgi:hypothetical protein